MSKTIRVRDDVYERIDKLLKPRDTFGDVVGRAITILEQVYDTSDKLGPRPYSDKRPKEAVE